MIGETALDVFPILFIPVTAQIAIAIPRPRRYVWIGVLTGAMAIGLLVTQEWPRSLSLVLLFAASYVFVAAYAAATEQAVSAESQSRMLVEDLKSANRQLEANAAQIQALAVVEERNRLARELHDSVSQSLYGLALAAEAARRRLGREPPEAIAPELDAIGHTARQALGEMRLLIFELRPPALQELGLAGSLQSRLNGVEQRSGVATTLDIRVPHDLPADVEAELDRIAQETLNNALKHANATRIDVTLIQSDSTVALEIADNGTGFEPGVIDSGGMGLRGLQERATRIGGQLTIESSPGVGTKLRVVAPV
jgi:signal transduction histidine kinase